MGNIIYNQKTKEIQFIGEITSFVFYNQLFDALREHYKENGKKAIPTFSFMCVDYFDSLVVPNLVGIGRIINKIHNKEKVPLKFAQVSSTKFLDNIGFFIDVGEPQEYGEEIPSEEYGRLIRKLVTQKRGLSIFDFDPRHLGFYINKTTQDPRNQAPYNQEHKVRIFPDESYVYYSRYIETDSTEEELDAIRTDKYDALKPWVEKHFAKVLEKNREIEQKIILKVLTEIICNSVLYSGSICAAMLQSKDKKTTISISDFGVGFEYSFEKKKAKFKKEYKEVFNTYSLEEQIKFKNYLYIFEALEFSKKKSNKRENLYTLLRDVVKNRDGKMRIHYENTQVVFTTKRCENCREINPIECSKCLLRNRPNDGQKSPVRFFRSNFPGVHIEVELNF